MCLPRGQSGVTVTEVLVSVAISSIVLMGVVSTLNMVNRSSTQYNLSQARNEIINKIRVQSLNTQNLISSAKLTEQLGSAGVIPDYGTPNKIGFPTLLTKCLPDISGTENYGCDKASVDDTGKGAKFYLTENGIIDVEHAVAGEDIFYKSSGARCSSAEAASPGLCPLIARVWLEPFCLNFAQKCTKAMSLEVRYSIGVRADSSSENIISTLDGEFYIPLQRGIQITHLFNQADVSIAPNSKGIFTIPKYNGSVGQTVSGLRLETTVSNPYGLMSMRVQVRSLVGPQAKSYKDNEVPSSLNNATWADVPTPSGTGAWSIDLKGAFPNQVFNFGTQLNIKADSRKVAPSVAASYPIGSSNPNDPVYHWTVSGGTFKEPLFKSGFYQFRVLATDAMGGELESVNYITVRIVPIPEFNFLSASFNQTRDCDKPNLEYSILVGDDEGITSSEVKVKDVVQMNDPVNGTNGVLKFTFLKSSAAGGYPIKLTLKNIFSDELLETLVIPKVETTQTLILSEFINSLSAISSNPTKIRVNTQGILNLSFTTGNCCKSEATTTWSYIASSYFPNNLALLSGPATTAMNCAVNGSSRTCSASNTVTAGPSGGPVSAAVPDVSALISLADAANPACVFSSKTTSKYVPVVEIPTVYFLTSESLWLNMPAGTISVTKPTVTVRSDFAPVSTFKVDVANAIDPSQIFCTLTFNGSATAGSMVDQVCDNLGGFSGDLVLQKVAGSTNVQVEGDPSSPIFDAKLAGNIVHRTCQAKITSLSDYPELYTVPEDKAMNGSPYGSTMADNVVIQDPHNDTGVWLAGKQKKLRCYQSWGTYNDLDNQQDYSGVYKYNNDTIPFVGFIPKHKSFGAISGPVKFSTYAVPANPPLIIDTSAKTLPSLFVVMQEGSPGSLVWSFKDVATGASGSTSPQPWEDVTGQLCSGSSSLSKIKIMRSRLSVESGSGNLIMKAANEFYSMNFNGTYSFAAMCSYGRWHPSGKDSNNWID